MDAFKEREAAAEARYIHQAEVATAERLQRIRALGCWACRLMEASPAEETRYLDLLYHLGLSAQDDRIIIDRVHHDVAAAGVSVSKASISEMFGLPVPTP